MESKWKSFGKAFAYLLLFVGMQSLTAIGMQIYILISNIIKYPELLRLSSSQIIDLIVQMNAEKQTTQMMVALMLANLLSLLVVWLIFCLRKKKFHREVVLRKTGSIDLGLAALIGVTVPFVTGVINNLLPYSQSQWEELEQYSQGLPNEVTLMPMLAVGVIAPITEEFFFRGLVHTRLRRSMSVPAAVILSSVFFGLGHGGTIWFLASFLAGLLLSWSLERTGSLLVPIVIHMGNNLVAQVLQSRNDLPLWMVCVAVPVCIGAVICLWKFGTKQPKQEKVEGGL